MLPWLSVTRLAFSSLSHVHRWMSNLSVLIAHRCLPSELSPIRLENVQDAEAVVASKPVRYEAHRERRMEAFKRYQIIQGIRRLIRTKKIENTIDRSRPAAASDVLVMPNAFVSK